jgi:hypothetical protein
MFRAVHRCSANSLRARANLSIIRVCRAVHTEGKLFSKGSGVLGALGQGDSLQDSDSFQRVSIHTHGQVHNAENDENSLNPMSKVVSVAAGWGHSAAVTSDGDLFIFGRPYDFSNIMQINRIRSVSPGLGRFVGRFTNWLGSSENDAGLYTTPIAIAGLESVSDVRCSAGLTIARTHTGDLYSFGLNRWGQCGVDQSSAMVGRKKNQHGIHIFEPTKIPIPGSASVDSYDIGLQHGVALADGVVYCWGKGNRGQLGDGKSDTSIELVSVKMPKFDDNEVGSEGLGTPIQVCAGFAFTACLTDAGHVLVWGKGMSTTLKGQGETLSGQGKKSPSNTNKKSVLSVGSVITYEDQIQPRLATLPDINHPKIIEISSSNFTLVARDSQGGLWALGVGEYDRNTVPNFVYTQQAIATSNNDVSQVEEENNVDTSAATTAFIDDDNRDTSSQSSTSSVSSIISAPVCLPFDTRLKKGYQRVLVLPNLSKDNTCPPGMAEYECSVPAFELVLHEGEAFLQEAKDVHEKYSDNSTLIDYSTGWQHSLAIYS